VGPPSTIKPASCQEIYFYFLFDVWDLVGYNSSRSSDKGNQISSDYRTALVGPEEGYI